MSLSMESTPPSPDTVGTSRSPADLVRGLLRLQAAQIVVVLIVIVAIFTILAPHSFPQWSNLRQVVQNLSILGVLGIGMTFVIVTSGIDLSIGSVLVFASVVSGAAMRDLGGQGWGVAAAGTLVAIACGAGWGFVNGFFIAKAKVPPLIVTLGSLGAALGLAEVFTKGIDIRSVPDVLINNFGYGNLPGTTIPNISAIALVLLIFFGVVLRWTRFGLHTFAIGSNEEAARRVGIKVDRHLIAVYSITGALSGFAGILSLAQYGTTTISGQSTTNLVVIAAVVIGGTSLFGGVGTIFGTAIGLLIPAILQNGFVIVGVQPFWQQVAVGGVLVAAVYVDQQRRAAAARGSHKHSPSLIQRLWTPKRGNTSSSVPTPSRSTSNEA